MGLATCDGSEPLVRDGFLSRARFGLTSGATGASLRFSPTDGGPASNATLMHRMTSAFFEWRPTRRWSVGAGAGALLGGRLDLEEPLSEPARTILPGPLASLSTSYLAVTDAGSRPFVLAGASFAAGFERLAEARGLAGERLTALDLRVSLTVGKTFSERLRPYASVRAFGGPVFLGSRAVGSDRYHLQAAAGLAVVLPFGLDAFGEASPGPERSVTFGFGLSPGR